MAVLIRLARHGRTHRPFYRVVAIDSREHREGRPCEILGTYDPLADEQPLNVDLERVHRWIAQGARYTDNTAAIFGHLGVALYPEGTLERRARQQQRRKEQRKRRQKKDPAKWVPPSRRALKKHRTARKRERVAQLEREQEERRAAAAKEQAKAEAAPEPAEGAEQPAAGQDEQGG